MSVGPRPAHGDLGTTEPAAPLTLPSARGERLRRDLLQIAFRFEAFARLIEQGDPESAHEASACYGLGATAGAVAAQVVMWERVTEGLLALSPELLEQVAQTESGATLVRALTVWRTALRLRP